MRCEEVIESWPHRPIREMRPPWPTTCPVVRPVPPGPSVPPSLDRLWQATAPAEPAPHVWDNLWASVASSLDGSDTERSCVSCFVRFSQRIGKRFGGRPEPKPIAASPAPVGRLPPVESDRRGRLGAGRRRPLGRRVDLAFFRPTDPLGAMADCLRKTSPTAPRAWMSFAAPLPSVDIEEGHLVVILADPKNPTVVDRTPKVTVTLDGVDYSYVNLDLDWFATYNRVESLAKPDVAMKE